VILRGYGAVLDGDHPHLLIEHLEGPTFQVPFCILALGR
jgi:hypothetical protein